MFGKLKLRVTRGERGVKILSVLTWCIILRVYIPRPYFLLSTRSQGLLQVCGHSSVGRASALHLSKSAEGLGFNSLWLHFFFFFFFLCHVSTVHTWPPYTPHTLTFRRYIYNSIIQISTIVCTDRSSRLVGYAVGLKSRCHLAREFKSHLDHFFSMLTLLLHSLFLSAGIAQ